MPDLLRYDSACRAIAECRAVDDVKDLRDKAEAIRIYARQARNRDLEIDAAEIRLRAEYRIGELKRELRAAGRLHEGGRPPKTSDAMSEVSPKVKLADLGVDDRMSRRVEKLVIVEPNAFERLLARWRAHQECTTERVSLDLVKAETKSERRATREKVLGGILHALPQRRYGVILADPEWRFEPWSRETGLDRSPDNHYPTSCLDVIKARDVPSIAADHAVLFLWATVPMLPHALVVMAAWGFDYVSHQVWRKDRIGTGYWFRNQHELVLVGTRGDVPAPAPGQNVASVFDAPLGAHSAKPEAVHELIERWYPTLPKIELNRRGPPRPGWDAWGNEAAPADTIDPETGEVFEIHESPSNRDASTDGEAWVPGAPQGNPDRLQARAEADQPEPAGREGHSEGEVVSPTARTDGDRVVPASPPIPPRRPAPADDDIDIPNFLKRDAANRAPCMTTPGG